MTLNGQEIRHALHPGPVREYLKTLAESDEFIKATGDSISPKRMGDRECVLRFLAFHINPWEDYSINDLDGYLGKSMDKINSLSWSQRDSITADFNKAMCAAYKVFDDDAFRKPRDENGRRSPVNRALFEAWSVQLARCSPEQINLLVKQSTGVQRRFRCLMNEDDNFDRSVSYSTGIPRRVRKRFQAIAQLVKEII